MRAPLARTVRWAAWDGAATGLEHLEIAPDPPGVSAAAVVIGSAEGGAFGLSYRLRIDADWRVLEATVATASGNRLVLRTDGAGGWRDEGGRLLPELAGCIDLDIEATPFTNTLPIRRLALAPGASADIAVAYIGVPTLALSRTRQRYTRLADGRYRFEALDSGFTADLPVDSDGVVLDYPGLFRRL